MKHNFSYAFIILAGGLSSRFGSKKELAELPDGGTPLSRLITLAANHQEISRIHLVYNPSYKEQTLQYLQNISKPSSFSICGSTRQESVFNALKTLEPYRPDFVLIHDGARPRLSPRLIEELCRTVPHKRAVIPVIPPSETIKMIDTRHDITTHLPRVQLAVAQTPQAFSFPEILSAHHTAAESCLSCTDDAEVWSTTHSSPVFTIEGETINRKITFKEDIL